jgi:SNF2 family DNA or RNA helicase
MYKFENCNPYPHQIDILEKSFQSPNLALFWEMGTGKTLGVINILRYRYAHHKRLLKTLILTPKITLYNWQEEITKFSKLSDQDIVILDNTGKKRTNELKKAVRHWKTLEYNQAKIVIMNYEALQTDELFTILQQWQPEVLVADESHRLKNPRSKRAKRAVKLADESRYRYILSGSPILNKISDVFFQYRFLDQGKTFGKNFSVFQNKYMLDRNAGWSNKPGYFPKYEPRPEMYPELQDKLYKIATRITKDECLDLPPLIKTERKLEMARDQAKAYEQMEKEFIAFVEQKEKEEPKAVVAQLAVTKALRLMQICSGFATAEDGTLVEFKKNPKIDATKELLEDLVPEHKVILWCSFRHNYVQLENLCKKMKINYAKITGDMSMPAKREAMDEFRGNKDCHVVIANRKAAGIGINLVEASYSIVFSRNFSLEDELQSEARNHRGGSQIHERIVKIDLTCSETIDEHVLLALNSKQAISDAVIDYAKGAKK